MSKYVCCICKKPQDKIYCYGPMTIPAGEEDKEYCEKHFKEKLEKEGDSLPEPLDQSNPI